MMRLREIVTFAFLTVILFISQIALGFLPNIEVVSLLIMVYTLIYGKKVFFVVYGFAVLEGLFYGFGTWWIMYLYVWSILAIVVLFFRKNQSLVMWAVISGSFGAAFGFLCSFPYYVILGPAGGFAYFISGIPFDILHCVGNIIVTIVLFKPVFYAVNRLELKYGR